MIRIVFTGSESTGKSTLAADVARHYGVDIVPEFVRTFAEQKGGAIEFSDHGAIARGQMALEDWYRERTTRLLVQDTDLLSTVVYCRHYFERCPSWIEEAALARRPDLYLLCATDVPWVADGVRDRGHLREEMQRLFESAVKASQAASANISGPRDVRLARAIDIIDQLIKTASHG
jgi:NadR type nicotinamide-nucleotide adenylyltransferase